MNERTRRKLKQYFFIGILFVIVILFGVNYVFRPFEKYFDVMNGSTWQAAEEASKNGKSGEVQVNEDKKSEEIIEPDKSMETDKKESVEAVFEKLSTKDKIAQMIAYPLTIDNIESDTNDKSGEDDKSGSNDVSRINELNSGFITIFGNKISFSNVKQKIEEIKNSYEGSLLSPKVAVDHEGGIVQRLGGKGYTLLPSWGNICSLDDAEQRDDLLKKSAQELKNSGIDIVLAPVLDVGDNKLLADRICSNSYSVVATRSVEFISIFNSFNILPVVKHFPGIGKVTKDLHNNFDFIEVLKGDVDLYKYVIDHSHQVAVMVSHVGVASQDPQVPCSLSIDCINELKTVYPKILVFSDALEMESASFNKDDPQDPKDLVQVSKEAVTAGDEVLIYGQSVTSDDIKDIILNLSWEYETNENFKTTVDNAVLKILNYKNLSEVRYEN